MAAECMATDSKDSMNSVVGDNMAADHIDSMAENRMYNMAADNMAAVGM